MTLPSFFFAFFFFMTCGLVSSVRPPTASLLDGSMRELPKGPTAQWSNVLSKERYIPTRWSACFCLFASVGLIHES